MLRKQYIVLLLLLLLPCALRAQDTVMRTEPPSADITDFSEANYKDLRLPLQVRCGIGFPPFEFINEQGQPDGFNVEIIHAIMEEIGVPYVLKVSQWSGVVDSLSNSQIDFVGGMTCSPGRSAKMNFGLSHIVVKQMFIVKEDAPYKHYRELSGKVVATRIGGFSDEFIQQYNLNVNKRVCPSVVNALDQLLNDQCDAVLLNDVSFEYLQKTNDKYKSLRAISSSLMPSEYSVACSKKNSEVLLPRLNEAIFKLRKNGKYDEIYQKWFGKTSDGTNTRAFSNIIVALGVIIALALLIALFAWRRSSRSSKHIEHQNKQISRQIESIKNNEATLKNIINMMPAPILVLDVKDNFSLRFCNNFAESSFKIKAGMTLDEYLDADCIYLVKNDYLKVSQEGKKASFQRMIGLKSGSKQYAQIFHEPIEYEGHSCILTVCMIITNFKKIEEELRAAKDNAELSEKQKSAFLADMSHEIRNPLNAILGFAQLLNEDYLDEAEKAEFSRLIKTSSEQLMGLLNDILDFSKFEADMMEFNATKFDFAEFFDGQCASFRMQTEQKGLQFLCESPYKKCMVRDIDKTRMGQIFTNFFSNALKFTDKGSITVVYRYEREGIYFSVTDTGIGIEKEKQQYIFERYKQLNNTKKGTGLGMAICKQIVDLAKGEIGFTSEPGKGSTFFVWWPTRAQITE